MQTPVFDKELCKGKMLQGYSGCCCDYCRSFKLLKGRWIVNIQGAAGKETFEISVLRENNRHGIASYGWFDEEKLLISHNGGPCHWPVTPFVWEGLVKLATYVADQLNKEELV